MPKASYNRSRSTKKSTPQTSRSRSNYRRQSQNTLTTDQKLNFIGGLLMISGLLSLVALLSSKNGPLTAWVAQTTATIAGVGGFIIPVALIILGFYLLLRKFDKLPHVSGGRTAGIILIYLNVLGWIHFFNGGGYETAKLGKGGGLIGAGIDSALFKTLGGAGEVVFLVAWFLVALIFVVDISLPELVSRIGKIFQRKPVPAYAMAKQRPLPRVTTYEEPPTDTALPEGFASLDLQSNYSNGSQVTPRREPAQRSSVYRTGAQSAASQSNETLIPSPVVKIGVGKPEAPWTIPAVADILDPATPATIQSHYDKDRARIIEETLASFGAPAHIVEIHRGPAVTQFGVEPDFIENRAGRTRVRVAKIVALEHDLALSLAAPSIRIQAPVPGKGYVGIEVPNSELTLVSLRELVETETFRKIKSTLRFALGKDVAGKPVCADLTAMPHLLIAGTTNSGKSVLVNALLCSLLLNNSPADLRLLLVDPKRVELTGYNNIPHLLAPVVVDAERVTGALQWVLREMDQRYKKFASASARNITEYNRQGNEKLPYLVIVIDELSDLMMLAPDETEHNLTRLAQLARATGIHLIISTQRPSVDVLTGLIKANFPARIAFMVASNTDSRVILDAPGADRLLGRGDMLYQAPDAPAPVRLQGVYVSDPEIQRLVDAWRVIALNRTAQGGEMPEDHAVEMIPPGTPLKQPALFGDSDIGGDPLLNDATEIVRREGKASISMLQRKMRVGYTRAARLVDTLEEQGIIGPQQHGSQVREILDYGDVEPAVTPTE
jgi:S-DNA-T family DNA segregation ATPase FtsK/SpoIIIE